MLWLVWVLACDDNAEEVGGFGTTPWPNNGGGGGPVVGDDWADVQAVLYNNCKDCHTGPSGAGGFDLIQRTCEAIALDFSYGHPLVKPGDHEGSTLWHKVQGDDPATYGPIMPPSGRMADENVQTITDWIDAGAQCPPRSYDMGLVQTIFDNKCVVCHNSEGIGAPLDLTDGYAALLDGDFGRLSRYPTGGMLVDRANPADSFLLRKLKGKLQEGEGEKMPLDGEPLSTDELTLIYGWISEGARPPQ